MALIAGVIAVGFTACEPTTNVKWKTASTYDPTTNTGETDGIYGIAWEHSGQVDTSWSEQLLDANQETDSKTVGELTGIGACYFDGSEAVIDIDDTSTGVADAESYGSATLKEGVDATLVIAANPAKK